MSRKDIARRLVLEAAILDVLKDLHAETRDEARTEYESGDADSVKNDGVTLGRVRRDKEAVSWKVTDWSEFTRWVSEHIPSEVREVVSLQVNPGMQRQLLKDGTWTDPETGEVLEVAGVQRSVRQGNLVVTKTDEGMDAAHVLLGKVLEVESGD